jgi:uncharacterized Zn-binding protein involved in type VI secretion
MPAMHRVGDNCTGHGCFPPRPANSGSPSVLINSIPAVRVGDSYNVHCCGPACHSGVVSSGSGSVLINSKPAARVGDSVSCGGNVSQGSGSVMGN